MTIQLLKINVHSKYLEIFGHWSTAEMWTHVTNLLISLSLVCTNNLRQPFDAPAPHVEWAVKPLISALDSTDFNH